MLPAGAPLPNEEQLDYSIAIEYDIPPVPYQVPKVDSLDVDSISIRTSSIVFVSECVLVVLVAVPIAKLSRFNKGGRSTSPIEVNRRSSLLSRSQQELQNTSINHELSFFICHGMDMELSYSIIIISPPFHLHLLRYHNSASTTLPPGPPGSVEMLIAKRINATVGVRRKSVDNLLMWIEREARGHRDAAVRGVHVAHFMFLTSFNILGNLMFSESAQASELFSAMTSFIEWAGYPNLVDSFPWLGWVDPQGLRRRMDRDLGKALAMASGLVKKRVKEREEGGLGKKQDFLDEMFLAGSETTSSTTEWAMVDLLRHQETMAKAKAELNNVVGSNRKIEESDIDNLQYLQAVVKETMRLHPSFPLLTLRKTIQDTNFMGYQIPKNTQVLVNAQAIGRDPECWDEPESFKPERFLGSKIDYPGQHYEFIPFGARRRMCAGIPLAHRMVHLLLGSLLHEFEWELHGNVSVTCENMDI
ncbi:hypothetical protein TEA_024712 [Camellia sinensis var. sinensis]|uniref:Cytochrome P450 n=1 Tax=Camellia sinensis var. sinensis TaxID=542762 RepID=A0A4S4EBP6_CAMSN|nr:hypothetical protein TEA_024712 [Camellia sinensis var. sinensis]